MQEMSTVPNAFKSKKRILVVEGDDDFRFILHKLLHHMNYEVLVARDGFEAIDIIKQNDSIGIVILDLSLPRMSGEETYTSLMSIDPFLKVIMSSSYRKQDIMKGALQNVLVYLEKPYTIQELEEALSSVDA